MPITQKQAVLVGRIRDVLRTLGYEVPKGTPGTPGTLSDLAAMAPVIGKVSAKMGPVFVKRMQGEADATIRAEWFLKAIEGAARRKPAGEAMPDVLLALGKGFMAFRGAKTKSDRVTTVLGVLNQITAATSR